MQTRRTRTTTTTTTFAALVAVTTTLAACSGSHGTSLTADETALCTTVSELGGSTDAWNEAFAALANVENTELASVGRDFTQAPLTSVAQAEPYRDRALRECADAGWTAPTQGQGD